MKIAIVVHGRFHAFDLARALGQRGHTVKLLTNYPKWATRRFGIPNDMVYSFWPHGILSRIAARLYQTLKVPRPEAWLHRLFGRWAAGVLRKETWDVIHPWSGVAEETLRAVSSGQGLQLLMRGSAHVRVQADILQQEEQRTGVALDRPSSWMVAREEREYQFADQVVTLSQFAYQSFIDQGMPPQKLRLLPLGVDVAAFRPPPAVIEARCQRLLAGEPLRVLYVGALSLQKGMWDLRTLLACPASRRFCVRLLGPQTPEVRPIFTDLLARAEWIPQQPQASLPHWYAWGDVFLFPSLQDGFAAVLSQAQASGLPIVATTNCGGPEVVQEGETGWIVPIRRPDVILERLQWCDTHRQELANMVWNIYAQNSESRGRDWLQVAAEFETLCS